MARRRRSRRDAKPRERFLMNEAEIIERAEALPDRFADRLGESALWSMRRMLGGGEYGELAAELAASLAADRAPVTAAERDDLRALLTAMGLPTEAVDRLNVRD
jgi:hypothetical protein